MGETLEIRDIHGNTVRVPFYGTLVLLAKNLLDRSSSAVSVPVDKDTEAVLSLVYRDSP